MWLYPEHKKRENAEPIKKEIEKFLQFMEKGGLVVCNAGSGNRRHDHQLETALKEFFQFDHEALEREKAQMAERKRRLEKTGSTK